MGIAKKKLFGEYTEPEIDAGSYSNLLHTISKNVIGAALRTKKKTPAADAQKMAKFDFLRNDRKAVTASVRLLSFAASRSGSFISHQPETALRVRTDGP